MPRVIRSFRKQLGYTRLAYANAATLLRHSLSNPRRVEQLACAIYTLASQYAPNGPTKLRPPDINTQTAYILIDVVSGCAAVRVFDWGEYHNVSLPRMFEIEFTGRVTRVSNDRRWRTGPLVFQLEALLNILRCSEVRFNVSRVRHEDQ